MNILQQIKRFCQEDWMSFLYGAVTMSAIIGFLPHLPQIAVYAFLIAFALYSFSRSHKYNAFLVALLIYIPIELLIAQPSAIFKSWQRYVMFTLLLCCVSPLFDGEYHRAARRRLMQMLLWSCTFIGIGSFFAWFLGINYMVASSLDIVNKVGLFGGLTTHSMLLGPISGIGAIFMSYYAFTKRKNIFWLFMFICLISVLFSASRSALMSSLAGIVIALYKLSSHTIRFLKIGAVSVVLAAATFSIWGGALEGVIEKNGGQGNTLTLDSRQSKWDARVLEFKTSPLVGVGFTSVDVDIASESELNVEQGGIETGTSWLIILSMLGIIGAVILYPFFIKTYITIWKQKDQYSAIVVGVLTLMYIHMFAEGYIFSAGSFMCFALWLTVGVANDSKYIGNKSL